SGRDHSARARAPQIDVPTMLVRMAHRHRPQSQTGRWKRGIILHCMNDPQPEGHMASYLGRRKFLATLGGAAAAWPLAARAQRAERVRRVAFLHPYDENDPEVRARVVAFRQGLEALGWTENRNIRIEHLY